MHIKNPLGLKRLFEPLVLTPQTSFPGLLERFDDELEIPAGGIESDPTQGKYPHAVFRQEGEPTGLAPKQDRSERRVCILEIEVEMARCGLPEIGDLARDQNRAEGILERSLDFLNELGNRDGLGSCRSHRRGIRQIDQGLHVAMITERRRPSASWRAHLRHFG